jgi:redox-sensitive bicupin YhaK (pirin superfamily)
MTNIATETSREQGQGRGIARVVTSAFALEGGGFPVHRPFPTAGLGEIDPFLLLDRMGPYEAGPGEAKGAPDHPHRGFETVTYLLEGETEHEDSAGNQGRLGPGDVQWMTAGAGVVHSEMPSRAFQDRGGRMHGFQLWVNLPRRDKMIAPRYQDVPSSRIPIAATPDGRVRVKVIAGEALGARAVIDTRTPIFYLHFSLAPGARFTQPAPAAYNAFALVFEGEGLFGAEGRRARANQMVVFQRDGDEVVFQASEQGPLELLLVGGVPLREPVARYGPFVMNTAREIQEAIDDFRAGRMGVIDRSSEP